MSAEIFPTLCEENDRRIVFLIMDGLGGLPKSPGGPTELEAASTPNMDELAQRSSLGLMHPIGRGITPGSGPAHLGLFGYDPLVYLIGRGALSAAGLGFDQLATDLAARANFASLDDKGHVTDRRAGRIPTETCQKLCAILESEVKIPGVTVKVFPEKEHRAAVVFRASSPLSEAVEETDPQQLNVPPLFPKALAPEAQKTSEIVASFIQQAEVLLAPHKPANGILLRGFANRPHFPSFSDRFRLKPAALAVYPMYKGLAKLIGMDIASFDGTSVRDEVAALKANFSNYTFFFVHVKGADSAGEDGDFDRKVKVIEEVDASIPEILSLGPACLVITGDHSTPAVMKSHSWHPVPVLLHAATCRTEGKKGFGETSCRAGQLGEFLARELMTFALAHAGRLDKFGA